MKIDIKIDDPRNRTNDLPDKMFSMLAVYMLRQSDVPLFSSFSMMIHLIFRFAIGYKLKPSASHSGYEIWII